MPRYEVIADINCGEYKPGDVAEFSEKQAAAMPHALRGPLGEKPQAAAISAVAAKPPAFSGPKLKKRGKK